MKGWFLIVLVFTSVYCFAQKSFKLTDQEFEVGSVYMFSSNKVAINTCTGFYVSDTFPILDSVADFLKENKRLAIEIGVHTGIRGSESYNQVLSEKKALSLKDYLTMKGVKETSNFERFWRITTNNQ